MARPKKPIQLITGNDYSSKQKEELKLIEKNLNRDINSNLDFTDLFFLSESAENEFNSIFNALSKLDILNNSDKPLLAEYCNLGYQIKQLNRAIMTENKREDIKLKLDIIKTQNTLANNLGMGISNKRALLDLIQEQNKEVAKSNTLQLNDKLKLLSGRC